MTIPKLNQLLARELGRVRLSDDGLYKWEWSEDLFWPAYMTGKMVEKRTPGGIVFFEKEYRRDKQSHKLNKQWVITKWFAPEELKDWQMRFPGADYPADGYRIFSDWVNPPGMLPTEADTRDCIKCVREVRSMNFTERLNDMQAEADRIEKSKDSEVRSMVRNEFTAFLNEKPGARGNSVSMPWTKQDRL